MSFSINGKLISEATDPYIIAEIGINHNGCFEDAMRLVDAAAMAGVDAVKFQTFKTENIITRDAPKSTYHVETTGSSDGQSWFDLLKTQEMTREMHVQAMQHCHCLLYTSQSPRDLSTSRMPSSA